MHSPEINGHLEELQITIMVEMDLFVPQKSKPQHQSLSDQ